MKAVNGAKLAYDAFNNSLYGKIKKDFEHLHQAEKDAWGKASAAVSCCVVPPAEQEPRPPAGPGQFPD